MSLTLLCTVGPVVASAASLGVELATPVRSASEVTYTLDVVRPTQPVIVLLPPDAIGAQLKRGTRTLERSRSATSAFGPLGHSLPSYRLDDLHAGERIVLRLQPASASPPRLIGDVDVIAQAETAAGITGVVFGILLAVGMWQSTVFWLARDLTIAPFLVAVAARTALEAVRGGLMSAYAFGSPQMTIFVLDVIAGAAETAFVIGFLRLEARVTRRIIVATLAPFACAIGTVVFAPELAPIAESIWSIVRIVAALALIAVAVVRLRSGFRPAEFIVLGIAGNLLTTLYLVILDRTGVLIAALDPWIFQIGTAFPALVLAVGIPYRTRFVLRERERLERDLRVAEFAAEHDPLTGLLNRRGLGTWTAGTTLAGGCLLFIDLDGFKRVNDHAGHEAGDRTLVAVAGVLSAAVRSGDAVARVGGDEFVVVLDPRGANRTPEVAQRISDEVAALAIDGCDFQIGASVGSAEFGDDANFERTLAAADAEAYRIKAERRAQPTS